MKLFSKGLELTSAVFQTTENLEILQPFLVEFLEEVLQKKRGKKAKKEESEKFELYPKAWRRVVPT